MNIGSDSKHTITIIMSVFNGASTLDEVLASLEKQAHKDSVREIIFINDSSTDASKSVIEQYQATSSYKTRLINNEHNLGLSRNYNQGISACSTDYIILMHQDILLTETDCFQKALAPFSDAAVIATFPGLLHPLSVWKQYPFWQKCLFSRFVGKIMLDPTGKFDCYDRSKLIKHIGLFNEKNFRSAGEDGDMKRRIKQGEYKEVYAGFNVIHLHNGNSNFGYQELFKKEAQLAEAQGALLRLHGPGNIKDFCMNFFRQILLISLFIPFINIISMIITLMYMVAYTRLVYRYEYRNPRILLLPFINLLLLPTALAFSFKGFFSKTQRI